MVGGGGGGGGDGGAFRYEAKLAFAKLFSGPVTTYYAYYSQYGQQFVYILEAWIIYTFILSHHSCRSIWSTFYIHI